MKEPNLNLLKNKILYNFEMNRYKKEIKRLNDDTVWQPDELMTTWYLKNLP